MLYPHLFKPAAIGKTWVRNRVVMAPMFTNFASTTGEVSDELVAYYAARARGGAGMIIVESACVSPELCNQGPAQLNIFQRRHVIGLGRLRDAIKANGCCALIQLAHPGRQAASLYCGGQPVAPSAIACPIIKEIPRELSIEEINQIGKDFVQAAHRANLAGFDGVEIHAAHGYLINQFLAPRTNQRRDEYGGSLSNRMRFLLDIIEQIRRQLPGLILSVRLNIDDFVEDGLRPPESLRVCQALEQAGVDMIHCASGTYESGLKSVEPDCYPEGWRVYLAEAVKKAVNIPVITGGMIRSPQFADQILAAGRADFVFLGRPLLADPQWPNKARLGLTEAIRPCIACNGCMDDSFKGLGIRCTVNPRLGREIIMDHESRSVHPGWGLVIGGGPAGMQAALSLQGRGINTVLLERQSRLGGLMPAAAAPPYKERIAHLCRHMIWKLERSGVDIRLGQEFTPDILEQVQPDIVVVATGSRPLGNPFPGDDSAEHHQALDILTGRVKDLVSPVIVIGGGRTGCQTADYLARQKYQVEIIEKRAYLAADMERKNRRALMDRLKSAGVVIRTDSEVLAIKAGRIHIRINAEECLEEYVIQAGSVVWAIGFTPADEVYKLLQSQPVPVLAIGDCLQVRGFRQGILEGESAGAAAVHLLNDIG
ncbi:MAG: FAD-dependent oxidoreductase [Syntrophomonadaceae bacterium]